jgi:hypothetical protein
MNSKLEIRTQGVKGTEPSKWKEVGMIDILVDDFSINIDAFEGFDETYKRAKESKISFRINGKFLEMEISKFKKSLELWITSQSDQ